MTTNNMLFNHRPPQCYLPAIWRFVHGLVHGFVQTLVLEKWAKSRARCGAILGRIGPTIKSLPCQKRALQFVLNFYLQVTNPGRKRALILYSPTEYTQGKVTYVILLRNRHSYKITVDGESKCTVGSGPRGNRRARVSGRCEQRPEPRASHISLRPRHNSAITFPVRGNLHSWRLPL